MILDWHAHIYTPEETADDLRTWDGKSGPAWGEHGCPMVQQKHKGVLYCFATILPCGGPAFIRETERAIRELGLKGIFIHSSHKGHYPDDDEARPFWELVQELDVPVMIHPPHLGFGEEPM